MNVCAFWVKRARTINKVQQHHFLYFEVENKGRCNIGKAVQMLKI